jgi:membrane protein
MPLSAWKAVAIRTWGESSKDNVGLVAAGVAFYAFLALVPMLGAIVLTYGLVAEPETVIRNMQALTSVMPADAAELVGEQLMNVVQTSGTKKGFGLVLALALALFGARNGAGAIVTALNIAYEEEEKRGFIRVNLLALLMTAAAVALALLAIMAVAALGYLHELFPNAPQVLLLIGKVVAYGLFVLAAAAGAATLYRYAPSRDKAKWTWLTPGSLFVALAWLLLTLGFGLYVANVGNYDATYGSLGAVVVLLTWLYLSSYVVLFGAELNSELEHQTAKDTTAGAPEQMGQRGAWVADHVAGEPERSPPRPGTPSSSVIPQAEPRPAPEDQSLGRESYVASRVTNRVGRLAGLRKVGITSSVASTLGLALLRKRGRIPHGLALVATAVGLAMATREK